MAEEVTDGCKLGIRPQGWMNESPDESHQLIRDLTPLPCVGRLLIPAWNRSSRYRAPRAFLRSRPRGGAFLRSSPSPGPLVGLSPPHTCFAATLRFAPSSWIRAVFDITHSEALELTIEYEWRERERRRGVKCGAGASTRQSGRREQVWQGAPPTRRFSLLVGRAILSCRTPSLNLPVLRSHLLSLLPAHWLACLVFPNDQPWMGVTKDGEAAQGPPSPTEPLDRLQHSVRTSSSLVAR